jgi:glycosyltransferase involved in cell wall biosynthesis
VRVLIVAAWPPWPLSDGISLILHHHLRLLAPRHEITVLASGRPPGAPPPDATAEGLPASVPIEWYGPARSGPPDYARRRWASLRTGEPADVFRVEQQPLLGRMDAIVGGSERPDVVHLHGWTTARLARRTQGIPAVHHSIDAWSEVQGTQAPAGAVRRLLEMGQQRKVVRHEARHLEASTAVAVVAEADALALRRNAPRARIVVVPNGVEPGNPPVPPAVEPVLGFHGALSTVANQDAARVLVDEVLPRVRAEVPDARALVIGRDPPDDLRSDVGTGVDVTGEVDDVREALDRVAVYVAPMATGTGLKNKVLEAMAAGLPVVATSRAMNGIGAGDGVVIADTPDAMAGAVLALLRDPDRRAALGAAGRARVVREFSWERSADAIEQLWVEAARTGAK